MFAAFPPLAKSVLTKRNTKSRNKLSKRNKMHIKNHAASFGVMAARSTGTKKPLERGGEGGRIAVFEEAGPSVRLFS